MYSCFFHLFGPNYHLVIRPLHNGYDGEAVRSASIPVWPQVATRDAGQGGCRPPWNPPFALRAERQGGVGDSAPWQPAPALTETIKIRVTPEEKDALRLAAGPRGVSALFRGWLNGRKVSPKPLKQVADPRFLAALNRIGNNLNQIARGIHQANMYQRPVNEAKVLAHLNAIHDQLRRIRDDPRHQTTHDD